MDINYSIDRIEAYQSDHIELVARSRGPVDPISMDWGINVNGYFIDDPEGSIDLPNQAHW